MNMRRYEVTDGQWKKIKDLFPPKKTGRPFKNLRLTFNGILWVMCTGASWRDIPYGKWNTIYKCFAQWSNLGIFEKLSIESDFAELSKDCTYIKAHKVAVGAKKALTAILLVTYLMTLIYKAKQ